MKRLKEKKNKNVPKLRLNKESLCNLSDNEAAAVVGGAPRAAGRTAYAGRPVGTSANNNCFADIKYGRLK